MDHCAKKSAKMVNKHYKRIPHVFSVPQTNQSLFITIYPFLGYYKTQKKNQLNTYITDFAINNLQFRFHEIFTYLFIPNFFLQVVNNTNTKVPNSPKARPKTQPPASTGTGTGNTTTGNGSTPTSTTAPSSEVNK